MGVVLGVRYSVESCGDDRCVVVYSLCLDDAGGVSCFLGFL